MNQGWLLRILSIVLACTGCAAEAASDEEPTASTEQAITNGEDDGDDPAVVALLIGGKAYCTGVLVTPNVVATAAHCVSPTPPEQIYFGVRPTSKKGTFIGVSDTKIHPDFDEDSLVNDIAVIGLATKAPVAPLPIRTKAFDASFKGMPIRIVGFGAPSAGEDSNLRKRTGETTISSFVDDEFRLQPKPSQTCNGDSGGPALATIDGKEAVIGIASSGDSSCASYGRHIRIDAFVPFLQSYTKKYRAPASLTAPDDGGCAMATRTPSSGGAQGAVLLVLAVAGAFVARRRRG